MPGPRLARNLPAAESSRSGDSSSISASPICRNAASRPSFSLLARCVSSAPKSDVYISIAGPRSATATPTWCSRMLVGVPALAGLTAKLARLDLLLELRRWPVALVTRDPVHVQPGVVGHVEAAEIAEPERTHRPVQTLLHRRIDVFERCDAGVEEPVGLLRRRVEDPVDDEAVDLLVQQNRRAPHLAGEVAGVLHGFVRGQWAAHYLDQVHHEDRVKEMH